MKSIFSLVMAVGLAAMSAEAAPLCASPSELKLLKAAVLQQALTSAALSCHLDAEFGRFVAAYHTGMAESDRALKAFFVRRAAGESYDAYKARIAEALSARSLHEANFCAEAKSVFDIALKHKTVTPPKLIDTGYEHCGKPSARPVMAKVDPALHPVKPAPAPVPVPTLSPAARKALALAIPPIPVPRQAPAVRLATQAVAPKVATALPAKPLMRLAQSAAVEPVSESVEDDTPYRADDPVPNAYKPGAYWVDERRTPEGPPLVQGPDGRWYVIIGHHAHWNSD